MNEDLKEVEQFIKSRGGDPMQRIDCDGGGIYLKNLLYGYAILVRNKALEEVKEEIKKLKNK